MASRSQDLFCAFRCSGTQAIFCQDLKTEGPVASISLCCLLAAVRGSCFFMGTGRMEWPVFEMVSRSFCFGLAASSHCRQKPYLKWDLCSVYAIVLATVAPSAQLESSLLAVVEKGEWARRSFVFAGDPSGFVCFVSSTDLRGRQRPLSLGLRAPVLFVTASLKRFKFKFNRFR